MMQLLKYSFSGPDPRWAMNSEFEIGCTEIGITMLKYPNAAPKPLRPCPNFNDCLLIYPLQSIPKCDSAIRIKESRRSHGHFAEILPPCIVRPSFWWHILC